jgi:polyvinyl alcohol dehydrogenase (cytochrome)
LQPGQFGGSNGCSGSCLFRPLDGHLRGYSSETGQVVFDFNTVRDFQTVNGVPGKGGSLDGFGAVVANGMLFINSGYPRFGGMPGNDS